MDTVTQGITTTIIRVCTFNLRHGPIDRGTQNAWEKRRPIVKDCLKNMQPTIIGTQEGYPPQLNDILDDLNESTKCWSWIGEELDEWYITNAIFYRHDQFSLISTKTFWFNEHPSTIGSAWNTKYPRGCTCAQFQHIITKQPFIIYNTIYLTNNALLKIKFRQANISDKPTSFCSFSLNIAVLASSSYGTRPPCRSAPKSVPSNIVYDVLFCISISCRYSNVS
ncbi:unnamed protein product [Rotaria sordida]|uniref:Endonuclease/exonuclease/phosphatase domain-containing protein n=1 Tax=Rotaria sordida TaxID=392033 RepID=A0A814KF61_9BILA|nr:unnamed protein product [Rotaria sordida]